MSAVHYDHVNFIWTIANLLRGPYRPPQYRKVMLPLTVLRRLDCVLAPTKDKVIAEYNKLKHGKLKEDAIERTLKQKAGLAESKKRKDKKEIEAEELAGRREQNAIVAALEKMNAKRLYMDREEFLADLDRVLQKAKLKVAAPVRKAIVTALAERDPEAVICRDAKGNIESDTELRDTENVPLPKKIKLPIKDEDLPKLIPACEKYLKTEVLPHVPDAWIDHAKTKVGYEISFNRHFYTYAPPRPLEDIERDIKAIEQDILRMLSEVTA